MGITVIVQLQLPFSQNFQGDHIYICDMIKRNESDVGHIVIEILAKTVFIFLRFIVFSIDKFS